jgi:hypothetical protein
VQTIAGNEAWSVDALFWSESLNPIAEFFSDRQTIETGPQAHKPADSVLAVGKGARLRSLKECLLVLLKQRCLKHPQRRAHTQQM